MRMLAIRSKTGINGGNMDALQIAERVLKLSKEDAILAPELSPLKLQKLLFYIQAWYAANTDKRLFEDDIYAWQLGPVVQDVYHRYKQYGAQDLNNEDISISFQDDQHDADIKSVLDVYGKMSAYELVARTHKEEVWRKNYESSNNLIPFEEIKVAFKRKLEIA